VQHAGWKEISFAFVFAMVGISNAQPEAYNHPELNWKSIETDHFFVHFHDGAERTGRLVAKIAEEIYGPVTALYLYEPDGQIHFIVRDHDDYSNGGAFYYDNKVEIWATAMDFELRGTHNWLRNVVTHEFAHMISLGAARKITRSVPAFYFQALGYEEEKRPDVLRGYPNRLVSYPLIMTTIPPWFAEGVAQYQLPGLDYDQWDSHRDMLLRTATVEDKLLTYTEMQTFGKNSLGNERVYNQGYAFTSYLVERYGLETVRRAAKSMSKLLRFSFDGALEKSTGKGGGELYVEWKKYLQEKYAHHLREIAANKVEGKLIVENGLGNFHPRWSPDGEKLAFLHSGASDYLSTGLVIAEVKMGEGGAVIQGSLQNGVRHGMAWSPDGQRLVFSRKAGTSKYGSDFYDIYTINASGKKEKRVTRGLRAHSPDWSADGKTIAFVINRDGTENLSLIDPDGKNYRKLTDFQNGEQVFRPQWSPDGRQLLFTMSRGNGRDIYTLDLAGGKLTAILADSADSRDPVYSPDGRKIYFSWDVTGIFNIYSKSLIGKNQEPEQLTNVIGGAFMPSVNKNGNLAFSSFYADGYRIALLEKPIPIKREQGVYLTYENGADAKLASSRPGGVPSFNLDDIKHAGYDDAKIPAYETKPYKQHFSRLALLPRVMIDYGTVKLGSYFYSSDVLDKYGFIAGFAINRDRDYDLFGILEYRNLWPTIFLEAYNQVQHFLIAYADTNEEGDTTNVYHTDHRYNLVEVDVGARLKLNDYSDVEVAFIYGSYNDRSETAINNLITGEKAEATLRYNYLKGRSLSVRYNYEKILKAHDMEANPRGGRKFSLRYDREHNEFLAGFTVNSEFGTLREVYTPHDYNKYQADWTEYFRLPRRSGLSLMLRGGLIDRPIDSFFNFFGGGLNGIHGYPYYSIEGRRLLHGRATLRTPVLNHIDFKLLHVYFDKLFFGVAYDYGNAFDESKIETKNFKDSISLQTRLEMVSFYGIPTRLFFDAAYGFDKFKNRGIEYGRDWRFYFGLSFGYFDAN
jgi:Tol biopolymer transport system component